MIQTPRFDLTPARRPDAMSTVNKAGLEDVVVSTSDICFIDGREGRLIYRGYDVDDLGAQSTFEEVVYLLWYGALPTKKEYDAFYKALTSTATRRLPPKLIALLRTLPKKTTPMEVLRTGVSALSAFDPDHDEQSREAEIRKAIRLTAKMPTLVAAWERLRHGKTPIAPNPKLNLAANFLYMMFGKKPTDLAVKTFDVALILHADHELNASTFAARVTAATLSDIYSAITSAIGALKGPLHGGANQDVIQMLLEAKTPDNAVAHVKQMLAQKKKIPGFGHRVYRTEDPRATHLRSLSEELGKRTGHTELYQMSRLVEETIKQEKHLNANVDFYSASTYYSLGIPVDLFTPVFAISRMSGWTAHVLEQYHNNRLIRPRAEYKGNPDGMRWIRLADR